MRRILDLVRNQSMLLHYPKAKWGLNVWTNQTSCQSCTADRGRCTRVDQVGMGATLTRRLPTTSSAGELVFVGSTLGFSCSPLDLTQEFHRYIWLMGPRH